jgi:hypothetical protein
MTSIDHTTTNKKLEQLKKSTLIGCDIIVNYPSIIRTHQHHLYVHLRSASSDTSYTYQQI